MYLHVIHYYIQFSFHFEIYRLLLDAYVGTNTNRVISLFLWTYFQFAKNR